MTTPASDGSPDGATTPVPVDGQPAPAGPAPAPSAPEDLAAEVEKWKNLARKHEDRAKANADAARQLDEFRKASMTDQEKAVAEAFAQGKTEAQRAAAFSLVEAEIKLHANGRTVDVDTLIEGLDRTRFIDDQGQPARDQIKAWIEKVAPAAGPAPLDLGQGARGGQALALGSDPLEQALRNAVGIR